MLKVNQGFKLVAAAAVLALASQAHAANPKSVAGGVLGGIGGSPLASIGSMSTQIVSVTGINSVGAEGNAGNTVRTYNIGAGSSVVGIGWDVNLTAFDPSWLSELVVSFGASSGPASLYLTVGVGDDAPGTASYSSGGVLDLIGLNLNFAVGADGIVRLEFHEGFDDSSVSPDGRWNLGDLTLQVAAVPEPATYGLMALGLLAVGAMARRRTQR